MYDVTDRLDQDKTGCRGDCNECEVYAFCWNPALMEEHADAPGELMNDESNRLYP